MTRAAHSRLASLAAGIALAAASVLACLLLIEVAFRLAPALLPAGVYGGGTRHPELGMNTHGQTVIYNKVRRVVRHPNREGFLDIDHERQKPPGVRRIGFFGDSYVESMQVPLETVFYRQLGDAPEPDVETLGFGMSGWGTFHALRAFRTFAPAYDLDAAIYVFVENDLGDNLYELAKREGFGSAYPFAQLDDSAPDGFRERWVTEPGREPPLWALAKWLQRRSYTAHVVRERLAILRRHGLQMRPDRAAQQMTQVAGDTPGADDLAGTWPPEWAEAARTLGERILTTWAREAEEQGIAFAVLYVPRGEDHLLEKIHSEDTWKPWLERTTAQLGIPLIDPTPDLLAALEAGEAVYDDHWSLAGHRVVADFLATHPVVRAFPETAEPLR